MTEIIARTGSKDYPISIAGGLIDRVGERLAAIGGVKKVMVVTDTNVAPLYLSRVLKSLYAAGLRTASCELEAGEEFKTLNSLNKVYNALFMADITRSDLIVALGGGVVGDLVGLAAATYLRGVKLIQIPTSLMAQVDSAIGGKVAIDMPFGKNMVGAFYQPHAVLVDPLCLRSLPQAELNNGMAEIVKYGCIRDRALFERLEQRALDLEWAVRCCIEIKVRVVRNDERDAGERMLLNFGHSIGHALERVTQYKLLRHGEAVAVGMVAAARIGEGLGLTPGGTAARLAELLKAYRLPVAFEGCSAEEILHAMRADKKRSGDKLNLVLLAEIGDALIRPIELEALKGFLEAEFDA